MTEQVVDVPTYPRDSPLSCILTSKVPLADSRVLPSIVVVLHRFFTSLFITSGDYVPPRFTGLYLTAFLLSLLFLRPALTYHPSFDPFGTRLVVSRLIPAIAYRYLQTTPFGTDACFHAPFSVGGSDSLQRWLPVGIESLDAALPLA